MEIYHGSLWVDSVGQHENHPTRRIVLKATGRTSGFIFGSAVGSGLTTAGHKKSPCNLEPGLQGQFPLEEQQPTRTKPYCRNIDLVGHTSIGNRGANLDMAWYGDFAYVCLGIDQFFAKQDPTVDTTNLGTAVIDASNPKNPQVTDILQTHIHENAFEGLGVSIRHDLLIAYHHHTGGLQIHDLSDPAHPTLLSTTDLPITETVIPAFSPDEEILYMSHHSRHKKTANPGLAAVDISDPRNPTVVATHPKTGHAQAVNADGTRLYLAENGLKVFDISEIQRREDDPEFKRLGEYRTSSLTQRGATFIKNGREFAITQDEADGELKRPLPGRDGTFGGECPWGIVRVYDVTDGTNPRLVTKYKLDVNRHLNCPSTQKDSSMTPGRRAELTFYSPHYSAVDNHDNPNAAFFSWSASGLRVADFRDLANPTEIAYYNPPPNPDTEFGGYSAWSKTDDFVDAVQSRIRYRPDSGHIWFASVNSGFHIVKLTGDASDIPA